ncbi:Sphingolipid C4-hydroxylase [Lachnellula hyalina]|uniref:Sphingolipid C4-hydroxylase n=1 Tax=Lachnellula hyalina TaxID=1316788 RepID=A0A8H8R3I7_9HELO|nr:Sphingolipid C4-hydroxylase [Lachnellula hyalina]TVY27783.1 Sphingolipid C4-hydroxylase [Lachnellula hyalina]
MANITPLAGNLSTMSDLPPLPSYTLTPVQPLFSFVSDFYVSLLLPVVAYWAVSMVFHYIDVYDIWPQYRLHTPAEIQQRNHVSRYEVARDVIIQQIIQTVVGAILGLTEPEEVTGMEQYDVARWATRLRIAQRALPKLLALFGLNAAALSKNFSGSYPMIAGVLAGGKYPFTMEMDVVSGAPVPAFTSWEMFAAKMIYWFIIPVLQFSVAILFVDTWQYFLHRAMHINKWLYTTFHSRHHRLYVPYAFGALYNHPFEGFLLDTLGASIAYKLGGLTARQGILFFLGSTIKTVDDHCGYTLPWDPLQLITSNNAGYHDIHHQSWGIKTNFSQPFFTFWDRFLGTRWTGGDTTARYERTKKAAQFKADAKKVEL